MSQDPVAAGEQGESVIETDDVRARRRLETEGFAVPVVEYVLESDRAEPVDVRLAQTLPAGLGPDQVGLHPEFGREYWDTVEGSTLVYRRTLEPGELVSTICGLQVDEVPTLVEPELTVEPAGTDDEVVPTIDLEDPTEPSATTGEAFDHDEELWGGNEGASVDASDDGNSTLPTPAEESTALEATESTAASQTESSDDDGPSSTGGSILDEHAPTVDPADLDGVAGALVEELRSDELTDEQRDALRDELRLEVSESTAAFVEHLRDRAEARHEHLRGEIASMEESLERLFGVKADAGELEAVERDLEHRKVDVEDYRSLVETVDDLRSSTASLDTVQQLAAHVEELGARAAEKDDLDVTTERVAALEESRATIDALDDVADQLEDATAELEDELEALEERTAEETDHQSLVETVEDLEERLTDANETLETELEAAVEELHERVDETNDTLGERLDAAESRIDADLADHDAELDELREGKAEQATADGLCRRVADLDERKADGDDVRALRARVEREYVTESDVRDVVDRQVRGSLRALVPFGLGTGGLVASVPMAIVEPTFAVATFVVGIVGLLAWWALQRSDPAVEWNVFSRGG